MRGTYPKLLTEGTVEYNEPNLKLLYLYDLVIKIPTRGTDPTKWYYFGSADNFMVWETLIQFLLSKKCDYMIVDTSTNICINAKNLFK